MTGRERYIVELHDHNDPHALARTFSQSKDRAVERGRKMRDTVMEKGQAVTVIDRASGEIIWNHIASVKETV